MMNKITATRRPTLSTAKRSERIALALVAALGALLMAIAASARGKELPFAAKRTDRFTATLSAHTTIRIDNISGDIVATPGKEFSVVVTTSVSAPSQKRADEILGKTSTEQNRDDDLYSLETRWPGSRSWRDERSRRRAYLRLDDCRISARYEVTLPAGMAAVFKAVNGEVNVRDVDGDLDVSSVNGDVRVSGTRRSVSARTINGRVEASAALLPPSASVDCRTVNGGVTLTLPKDARFDLTASAMSGAIASTFPLPARADAETAPYVVRGDTPRSRRRIVVNDPDDGQIVVDLREIEREIEQNMREVEVEVRRGMREAERSSQGIFTLMPGRHYSGSIGQGGASVHASTLNGAVTILAAGTREADAKPLVSPRRVFRSITVPTMTVVVPRVMRIPVPAVVPRPVVAPRAPLPPRALSDEESIVQGDIAGDYLSTTGGANYQIGKVSGKVRILTRGGEIHVESAGSGADLKTYGGDIRIGPVGGEFRALTMAGDVKAGAVNGSASAETSGGDIRIDSVKGSLEARTGGGDVVVPSLSGGADVETGGGDVRLGLTVRQASVNVRNAGGDVTLTLPADFKGEFDLAVSDASPDETAIRSDFSELSVVKRSGSQQATGAVNGGGPKVVVRTSSGTIRIRKG